MWHTHKQEIELRTCVWTSFHFCQMFTDHWRGRTSFLPSEIIILFYFVILKIIVQTFFCKSMAQKYPTFLRFGPMSMLKYWRNISVSDWLMQDRHCVMLPGFWPINWVELWLCVNWAWQNKPVGPHGVLFKHCSSYISLFPLVII